MGSSILLKLGTEVEKVNVIFGVADFGLTLSGAIMMFSLMKRIFYRLLSYG